MPAKNINSPSYPVRRMNCELCGKEAQLFPTTIEGTELEVCATCGNFGNVHLKRSPPPPAPQKISLPEELEANEVMTENFAAIIKQAREKLGLKQAELAEKLNEKASIIHKIETGVEPSIALARKLERFLHVKLVSKAEEASLG